MADYLTVIAEANQLGLNIQYPWDIDWLSDDERPLGLFELMGWIEKTVEQMKEEEERKKNEGMETYSSDVYDESDLD